MVVGVGSVQVMGKLMVPATVASGWTKSVFIHTWLSVGVARLPHQAPDFCEMGAAETAVAMRAMNEAMRRRMSVRTAAARRFIRNFVKSNKNAV
jgi:hypothetical protein